MGHRLGGGTSARDALSSSHPDLRVRAARVLSHLAVTDACRAVIVAAGALPQLVLMLSRDAADQSEQAAGTLQNLAESDQTRGEVVAAGALPPLAAALTGGTRRR